MTDTVQVPESVSVAAHVHFGMTGSTPLRLADLFFTDAGLYIIEYGHVTPMFGLLGGRHREAAADFRRTITEEGLQAGIDLGDRVTHLPATRIERIVLYEGGWIGREKVAVQPRSGPPHAYRIHAPVSIEDLAACLQSVEEFPVPVDVHSGLGFRPLASVRRFLAGR